MTLESHPTPEAGAQGDPVDAIASLLMGDDDEGTDDASQDESPDTPEQTIDTDDIEDPDDTEELSDEDEDEEVDESENDDNEEEPDLAAMLGLDQSQLSVSDDGDFKINVKVDGKQTQVPLGDLIKGYQSESSNTNKSMTLSEDRKKFDSAVTVKAQEIQQSLDRNVNLAKILEQEIMSDYEKVDWDDLRQYDPAEWTAKRSEFQAKYGRVQRLQQELGDQNTKAETEAKEAADKVRVDYVQGQFDRMLENNPSWSDKAKLIKDMATLNNFAMETYGFSESDMNSVISAGVVEALKDAQAFRKGSLVAKKKLKGKVPKMQKRGKGGRFTKNKTSKLDKLTKAVKSAKGSTRRDLQTDAITELLMQG